MTTTNLQRKVDSDTKTKVIEKESKKIMWVWEIKLSYRLSQNRCQNIISLFEITWSILQNHIVVEAIMHDFLVMLQL